MTLDEAREAYRDLSGRASDIARQLGLAGIALIWLFKFDTGGRQSIPRDLVAPGILLVLSLGFDLAQYVFGALLWGAYGRIMERRSKTEFDVPPWLNWPSIFFFWTKLIPLVAAYVLLLRYLLAQLT